MSEVYEQCRANLEQLSEWYLGNIENRNEATTRLHLIDTLFLDCLAWTRPDIVAEESQSGQYADYTFIAPRRILIVEAKREGEDFEVPVGIDRLEYSLRTLLRDNQSLKSAIEQVANYCQRRGVPLGAVCNGHQVVVFIATRNDGISPLEGRCLVFPSIDFMLEHFIDLWQNLSKPGIEEGVLLKRLFAGKITEVPPKPSASFAEYPGIKKRNLFQTDLQIVSELILEDITRSRDLESSFLEECYCHSGAFSQHSLVSKTILAARYSALFDSESPGPTTVPATDKEGISEEMLADSMSLRPVLIIGDVGVGKTTFIRYLLKVDAVDLFDKAIALYIDLGSQATITHDLRTFIIEEIFTQLRTEFKVDVEERNFVRGVYHFDLQRFSRGIYSDLRETDVDLYRKKEIEFLENKINLRENHLKKSLDHLSKGRKEQIVIFLDNVDQREYEAQQEAFLISQEMAEHWPATVFVTLRPATFHRSQRHGALSGYHPKAFTVSPPRIDKVLKKRLGFALKITNGNIPIKTLQDDLKINLIKLDVIIRVFLETIEQREELIEFIDNICSGNVRVALDLVKNFFGSGHIDTKKIVEAYKTSGSYWIPIHEFLRAVIFGDYENYDPSRSIIANLFDVSYFDSKEHFLLPILLTTLDKAKKNTAYEGFMETTRVYERLQGFGFTPEQIDAAIIRAHRYNLIETRARRIPHAGSRMSSAFRITASGVYHVRRLCGYFSYMDAICVDTPIFDEFPGAAIHEAQSIDKRLDRAEVFLEYLDQQWALLDRQDIDFPWPSISERLRREISRIRDSLQRYDRIT
jgi:GTPase SAR1 family protein